MPERKKIAIILSRFPYPLDKGDKLRAYHQIKYISQFHDVYLYALTEEKVEAEDEEKLKPVCKEIHTYLLRKWEILYQGFKCLFNKTPIQIGYFYSPSIHKQIQTSILTLKPDVVYCQLSRTSYYGKNLPFKKVMDFQDAFSTNYERIQNNYIGFMKLFYQRESRYMKQFEKKMVQWFDETTIISEFDKDEIDVDPNRIVVVSNGVDAHHFKPNGPHKPVDLLFAGNLAYLPNKKAVQYLVEKIVPKLVRRIPDIRVEIVGASGTDFKKYESKNIHVSGWIEDIREAYTQSKLFVAPLFTGAGLQNKLLEAMSMGIPCITSHIANASLRAQDGKHILLANTPSEFVDKIVALLQDKQKQQQLSKEGRAFIVEHFSWDKCNEKLLELF